MFLILLKLAQVTHFGKPWLIANGHDLWSQRVRSSVFITEICELSVPGKLFNCWSLIPSFPHL